MPVDFKRHNEEVRQVWESYTAGKPLRVPFGRFTVTPRIWIMDPRLNTTDVTWKAYSDDPEVMFSTVLQYKHYLVHNVVHDIEMGIPEKAWEIGIDFENVSEEAWLGCEVAYAEGQVPASLPRFTGKHKYELLERGIPDPFSGILGKMREFYEYFLHRAQGYEFYGRPVSVMMAHAVWTDGPFTLANGVVGSEVLADMLTDEDYFHRLMAFLTEAEIIKVRAWRKYLGFDPDAPIGGIADDAIQFLSVKTYREKILPYHQRLYDALFPHAARGIHLCGNVQRLLPLLVKEVGIKSFDTGYPINFTTLRGEVGDDVEIQGGVRVQDLLMETPDQIFAKTEAILKSGIMRGGRFVMKEANNLAPMTPLANIAAVYAAVKQFGVYPAAVQPTK